MNSSQAPLTVTANQFAVQYKTIQHTSWCDGLGYCRCTAPHCDWNALVALRFDSLLSRAVVATINAHVRFDHCKVCCIVTEKANRNPRPDGLDPGGAGIMEK